MKARADHPTMDRIKALFENGQRLAATDVSVKAHIHVRNARAYLRVLKDEGLIHIVEWRRSRKDGPFAPIYAWGKGEDAERPRRKSQAELKAAWREKPGVKDRINARKRAKRLVPKVLAVQSQFLAALNGLGGSHASCNH